MGKIMNNLQKTIIERYTEKKFNDRNFTYRNYLDLRRKLTAKNVKDTERQSKVQEKIIEIENRPKTRLMTPLDAENILTTSVCGGLMLGATTSIMMGEPECFPLATGAVMGTLGGGLASIANMFAYQDKPLTNAINRTIVKAKTRKVKRIEDRKELRNYTLYCFRQQENDNKPDYEDFMRAVKENGEELSL